MRYGITMFATDVSIDVVELAREAEARGLQSLWLPEHTHIPTSRRTPPAAGQQVLPEEYKRCLDPLVALGAAAAATSTIRLGTGILLAAQREPIVTAKAVATLDHLSGGRAALGVGFGWNEDEIEHHGVAMGERRAVAREVVLAMQALWADDTAEFHGDHVDFSPSWSWPKPAQRGADGRPRVPTLLGGAAGPKLFAHLAEWADGWIPIGGAGLADAIPRYREAVATAGRDPEAMEIIPFGSVPDPGKLDHFERIGVTECVFRLPSAPRDVVLPLLDEQAALVAGRQA
jgi:probable F420-dependent oxidoreductase